MRPGPSLVAIVTCVVVAGCGGSSHSSTTQATSTATVAATTQTTAAQSRTVDSMTFSGGDDISSTTTTTSAAPPEVPKTKTHKHSGEGGGHGGVSQDAHVEANVTIATSGDISPPVVSVPSGVGVELHVANHGSAAATVALSTPTHPSAHVAPKATATLESGGLKNGTYRILVNGTPRGQLMIGAQGGP